MRNVYAKCKYLRNAKGGIETKYKKYKMECKEINLTSWLLKKRIRNATGLRRFAVCVCEFVS